MSPYRAQTSRQYLHLQHLNQACWLVGIHVLMSVCLAVGSHLRAESLLLVVEAILQGSWLVIMSLTCSLLVQSSFQLDLQQWDCMAGAKSILYPRPLPILGLYGRENVSLDHYLSELVFIRALQFC